MKYLTPFNCPVQTQLEDFAFRALQAQTQAEFAATDALAGSRREFNVMMGQFAAANDREALRREMAAYSYDQEEKARVGNQIAGAVGAVGSAFEIGAGVAADFTGIGAIFGFGAMAHGASSLYGNVRQVMSGRSTLSPFAQGLMRVGASQDTAEGLDATAGIVLPVGAMVSGSLGAIARVEAQSSYEALVLQRGAVTTTESGLNILNPYFTPNAATLNKATAFDFYRNAGRSGVQALDNMRGIDFSRSVSVVQLDANTILQQYVGKNGAGSYFSPLGTTGLEAGIGDAASRNLIQFQNATSVSALRSHASNFLWPSGEIVPGAGGGVQYYVPTKNVFRPLK